MRTIQRAAGYAALIQGVLLLIVAVLFAVILPARGFSTASDFTVWSKLVPVMSTYNVVNALAVLRSVVFLAVILGAVEWVQAGAPSLARLSAMGACVGSALFLAQGMLGIVAWPILRQMPQEAQTAGTAIQALSQSLATAGIFAEGWVVLLIGWVAWSGQRFSRPLSGVMILAGVLGVASFLATALVMAAMALTIVWTFWLGITLVRSAMAGGEVPIRSDQSVGRDQEELLVSPRRS